MEKSLFFIWKISHISSSSSHTTILFDQRWKDEMEEDKVENSSSFDSLSVGGEFDRIE